MTDATPRFIPAARRKAGHRHRRDGEGVMKSPPVFKSRLRPLSILELERMTPAQLQRREFEEAQERQAWLDQQRRAAPARRS